MAARSGSRILRVEDALLRSIHPGRSGEPPIGLHLDRTGIHFDSSAPSDLETLLATHPLDDTNLLDRARDAMTRLRTQELSKYNAFDPACPPPAPGYLLIIDQTAGDASIKHGAATSTTFREMLAIAQIEHPGQRIVIRTHPESIAGHRAGHYLPEVATGQIEICSSPCSPWQLLEGAVEVFTASSQLGFEAILAGHRPRVFGQPFYSGWGLTEDENPVIRRQRRLTRAQVFAAAMILYPTWYDPYRHRLCQLEDVIDGLEARARAYREDNRGSVATGMRLWKRRHLKAFFGSRARITFRDNADRAVAEARQRQVSLLAWAGKVHSDLESAAQASNVDLVRVEDGFLRSRGLGAMLVPPLSLVRDDLGIYYDPTQESRLERLISQATTLPAGALLRAEDLRRRLIDTGLSKYNIGTSTLPDLPPGRRILVPGQVEDDASIRLGCGDIHTNLGLLQATRSANPDAVLIYKPHPDVEAGLRPGAISDADASGLADVVATGVDPIPLLHAVDAVWTLTSLMGFEALLRGVPVTCLGAPFYAGWGLTTDAGPVPERRNAWPTLDALVHASLIAYPRYRDPITGLPCPVEVAVDRLETGQGTRSPTVNRSLSKLQGLLASRSGLWR